LNGLSMSPSDRNGPQRNSQLLDPALQIGETVRSNIRFESRWGRSSWIILPTRFRALYW